MDSNFQLYPFHSQVITQGKSLLHAIMTSLMDSNSHLFLFSFPCHQCPLSCYLNVKEGAELQLHLSIRHHSRVGLAHKNYDLFLVRVMARCSITCKTKGILLRFPLINFSLEGKILLISNCGYSPLFV